MLAIVIFGAVVAAFSTGILEGHRGTNTSGDRVRAAHLASEGLVAMKSIRNGSGGYQEISSKTLNSDYGVELSNTGAWEITSSANTIDSKFTRTIQFSNPNADEDQRLISSTITWSDLSGATKTVSLSTYITNWQTVAESPTWSSPTLTGSIAGPAGTTLEKIAVSGNYAFVAESTIGSIVIFDISDLNNPTYSRSITGIGPAYDVAIKDNYLYVGTSDTSDELKIIDITNPLTATCCTEEINFQSNSAIYGVSITGTGLLVSKEYDAAAAEFYVFDIEEDPTLVTISNPPTISDSATDTIYDSAVDGNRNIYAADAITDNSNPYAYLATNYSAQELTVVSLTGSNMTGGGDTDSNIRGTAVAIIGTGAYIGVVGTGPYELYSYDLASSISSPSPADKFDIGGDSDTSAAINDIATNSSYGYLFMATNTQQSSVNFYLRIHDVRNVHDIDDASRVVYSGNITAGLNVDKGIYYRSSDHKIFMVGGNDIDGTNLIILDSD